RGAARLANAVLDLRRECPQMEVARHRLDPGVGNGDDRLAQRLLVEPDALQVRACRRALRTLSQRAAAVLEIERPIGGGHRGRDCSEAWRLAGCLARARRSACTRAPLRSDAACAPRPLASGLAPTARAATGRARPASDRAAGPADA